tara:strand:- start:660 stop:851 length:192 start_codon:yes stop_codon:yes gene_type:complete
MPNEDNNAFKNLLGELNFFNKLSKPGKGLFTERDKAVTHPDDCKCRECNYVNLYFFNKGDFKR